MPKPTRQLIQRIKELHEQYLTQLPERDLDVLYGHLEGPYHGIGDVPPNLKYGSPELSKELNRIIAGAPRVPEDVMVFRGSNERSLFPRATGARSIDYPLTTTFDPGGAYTYAEGWMNRYGEPNPAVLAEIEVPAGSPGITLPREEVFEDIFGRQMPFGDEMELLLPQSTEDQLRKLRDIVGAKEYPQSDKYEMLIRRYAYEPPYKARGGLVHGNA